MSEYAAEHTIKADWNGQIPLRDFAEQLAAQLVEAVIRRHMHLHGDVIEFDLVARQRVIGGCQCGGYCDHLDRDRS